MKQIGTYRGMPLYEVTDDIVLVYKEKPYYRIVHITPDDNVYPRLLMKTELIQDKRNEIDEKQL